ncbi:MAG: lysostaphin resistance A-like protein [Mangrovibacterium sp.]
MIFSAFRSMRPSAQLVFGVFIVLICALVGMLVSYGLSLIFYGGFAEVQHLYATQDFDNPKYIGLLRLAQVVQTIFLFGIPPLAMAYLFDARCLSYLYLDKKPLVKSIGLSIALFLLALPIVALIGLLNEQMSLPSSWNAIEAWMKKSEDFAQFVVQKMVDDNSSPAWVNYLVIAVFPAIVEELFFRGALQRILIKLTGNVHRGIWIGAVIFSMIHLQFYGFFPRLLLGALLGYVVCYSGSLFVSIFLHFINNASALYFEFYHGELPFLEGRDDLLIPDKWQDVDVWWMLFAGFCALVSLFLFSKLKHNYSFRVESNTELNK